MAVGEKGLVWGSGTGWASLAQSRTGLVRETRCGLAIVCFVLRAQKIPLGLMGSGLVGTALQCSSSDGPGL